MGLYLGKEKVSNISVGMQKTTQGIDTSDATATADDILKGKTAYINGEKITGIVGTVYNNNISIFNGVSRIDSNTFCQDHIFTDSCAFKKGGAIRLKSSLSNFGTATAADVAAGKTFTSADGYNITGTRSVNSSVQYCLLSNMNPTSDITSNTLEITWNRPGDLTGFMIVSLMPLYATSNVQTGPFSTILYNDISQNQTLNIANPPSNWIYEINQLGQYCKYFSIQEQQSYIKQGLSSYYNLSEDGQQDVLQIDLTYFGFIIPSCIQNTSTSSVISDYLVTYMIVV